MTDSLFGSAFDGRVLHVSRETHAEMCERYPDLDLAGSYRAIDGWMVERARVNARRLPRNTHRFLNNWLRKDWYNLQRELRKELAIRREIQVGRQR